MQGTLVRLRQRRQETTDDGGFTLIEILIVIVILAILAAIVAIAVQSLTQSTSKASCEWDVQTVDHAVQAYIAQVGTAPTSITQLENTTTLVGGQTVGPWLHNPPVNGNRYEIIIADGNTAFTNYTINGGKAPAGTVVVEAPSSNTAPVGTLYSPPVGGNGTVFTTSDACAGVNG